MKSFLDQVVDVDTKDKNGVTPLMLAATNGHTEIVRLLLSTGAHGNSKAKNGGTALVLASTAGHTELVNTEAGFFIIRRKKMKKRELKRNLLILILLSALILLNGCAAGNAVTVPPNYQGPTAERPTYTPGDWWLQEGPKGPIRWTFLRQENDQFVFQVGGNKNLVYTTEFLSIIKEVDGQTGKIISETKTPGKILVFPLWVGKKWDFSFEVKSRNFGTMVTMDGHCKVDAYEPITVKAGVFEAFRIRYDWQARGYTDSGTNVYWYAPKVKRVIKENNYELIKYKIK